MSSTPKKFGEQVFILDTTNSTSTSTGSLVTTGGSAVLQDFTVGGTVKLFGANSNYSGLKAPLAPTNTSLTLPSNLPGTLSYLVSDVSGNLSYSVGLTSSVNMYTNNGSVASTFTDVTGFSYSSGNFDIDVSVQIVATGSQGTQFYKLIGVLSAVTGWNLSVIGISGDALSIQFSITAGGQIQYKGTGTYGTVTSITIESYTYITSSGNATNLRSGTNTIGAPMNGNFFTVTGADFNDNTTSASGTLANFYGSYIGQPTLQATNTSVTTTNASTLFIAGPVIASINETIINNNALVVGSGNAFIQNGFLKLGGSTSGIVSLGSVGGTYNFLLPSTAGTAGNFLASGGGSAVNTWVGTTGSGNVVLSSSPGLSNPTLSSGATISGGATVTGGTFTINSGAATNISCPLVVSNSTASTNTTTGSGTFAGGVGIAGNLNVGGSIAKGSGTFNIKHPILENKRLVHSFIEGPRCDLIYRGSIVLFNGKAIVDLEKDCVNDQDCAMTPGTFTALCTNAVSFLQNNITFDRVRGTVVDNKLYIESENSSASTRIEWMVVAERKDSFIKGWRGTNSNGFLITEI